MTATPSPAAEFDPNKPTTVDNLPQGAFHGPGGILERPSAEPECPSSERVDGKKHSWKFDGDDPYVICVYCGEVQDAISGVVITLGAGKADPVPPAASRPVVISIDDILGVCATYGTPVLGTDQQEHFIAGFRHSKTYREARPAIDGLLRAERLIAVEQFVAELKKQMFQPIVPGSSAYVYAGLTVEELTQALDSFK